MDTAPNQDNFSVAEFKHLGSMPGTGSARCNCSVGSSRLVKVHVQHVAGILSARVILRTYARAIVKEH